MHQLLHLFEVLLKKLGLARSPTRSELLAKATASYDEMLLNYGETPPERETKFITVGDRISQREIFPCPK